MTDFKALTIERDGAIAVLAFNRPEKLNTFDTQMRREFVTAARMLNLDDSVKVVMLTGNGRAFGAGADLGESPEAGLGDGAVVEDMLNNEYKPGILAIAKSSKPWVAAINGPCAGISYSYAMACDMVVMAESAFLYQPFAAIGLVPDGGSTWLLAKLVGHRRAFELMVMGEKLSSARALEWGMVNRLFADNDFNATAREFAQDLAGRSPLALRYTKLALQSASTATLDEAISIEAGYQKFCIDSEDSQRAVAAFFAKEDYAWQGK